MWGGYTQTECDKNLNSTLNLEEIKENVAVKVNRSGKEHENTLVEGS